MKIFLILLIFIGYFVNAQEYSNATSSDRPIDVESTSKESASTGQESESLILNEIRALQNKLIKHPERIVPINYSIAKKYFDLQDYRNCIKYFLLILNENISPEVRTNINNNLNQIITSLIKVLKNNKISNKTKIFYLKILEEQKFKPEISEFAKQELSELQNNSIDNEIININLNHNATDENINKRAQTISRMRLETKNLPPIEFKFSETPLTPQQSQSFADKLARLRDIDTPSVSAQESNSPRAKPTFLKRLTPSSNGSQTPTAQCEPPKLVWPKPIHILNQEIVNQMLKNSKKELEKEKRELEMQQINELKVEEIANQLVVQKLNEELDKSIKSQKNCCFIQ